MGTVVFMDCVHAVKLNLWLHSQKNKSQPTTVVVETGVEEAPLKWKLRHKQIEKQEDMNGAGELMLGNYSTPIVDAGAQ